MSFRLNTLVLKILSQKDMYGYEIVCELKRLSGDFFCLQTGTVYPLLRTMLLKRLIETYEISSNKQKQTFYKITPYGIEYLKEETRNWIMYSGAVNKVLGIKK